MDAPEPTDLEIALACADAGEAGHWPTAAAVLAEGYRAESAKSRQRLTALVKVMPILEQHCGDVFLESIRHAMKP